jgi:hypothetical protein
MNNKQNSDGHYLLSVGVENKVYIEAYGKIKSKHLLPFAEIHL